MEKRPDLQYDFIIVGGGSAGAVVASRLSEVRGWRVLLLEAGGEEDVLSEVPLLTNNLQLGPLDWQYSVEPQPGRACLALQGGRCRWPRGKALGGSSAINYMLYVRGNRGDYDSWASQGAQGWDWESVLGYFKKSEDNRTPSIARDRRHHATGGPLTVHQPSWRTKSSRVFLEAGREMGYQVRDCNGETQTGFMFPQATVRRGTR